MKKELLLIFTLVFLVGVISANDCSLDVELINQDPYPAIPGEKLSLVFQLNGVGNPNCNQVSFTVNEEFPFSVIQNMPLTRTINSGTFFNQYKSHWILPYDVVVNKDALDGNNNISVVYSNSRGAISKTFQVKVENPLNEFDLNVRSYNFKTKELSMEIINLGKTDVSALTLTLPSQKNAIPYGSNRVTIGSLDSKEDDIVNFVADLSEGPITFEIQYSDANNIRRVFTGQANFDESLFSRTVSSGSSFSTSSFIYGIILSLIAFFTYRFFKSRKAKKVKNY